MQQFTQDDFRYMQMAIDLAWRGIGWTSPNPMVGAVLVKDNKVIGTGYHVKCGETHAEVNAFNEAGEKSAGTTLYVTLEPCFHHGRTPPCVERVIESRVSRVVIAHKDPNPQVAGKSIAALKKAAIEVQTGCMEKAAAMLNEGFCKWVEKKIPFVHAKIAMTLDGKMATRAYDSCWITNELSREQVHWMRALYDSILVGIGTVLHDDPVLTCRLPQQERPWKQPLRIILDPEELLPENSKIAQTAKDIPTLLVLSKQSEKANLWSQLGVELLQIPCRKSSFDLHQLLKILGERQITSLLIEGGPRTQTLFWEQELVDKYTFFIAPKMVGGQEALSPIVGPGIEKMVDARQLNDVTIAQYGDDVAITGYT